MALATGQVSAADADRDDRDYQNDGDCSGLGQLGSLVARAQAAGLPVTVTVTGAERALAPEVDQAAYRIVQEALTNVSRHAGRACARVHLRYTPDALSVQVDDDGTGTGTGTGGPRPAGPGLGLIGMRNG
jgi:signal transduction histidine kinase